MKRLLQNLALTGVSILITLAVVEAGCRLIAPPAKPGLPEGMLEIGPHGYWRVAPNFHGAMNNNVDYINAEVSGDSAGRRVVPAAPAEAPRRLFVLGDSQTFGHGVSDRDSWPNRLQERLNRRGLAVKVLNYAIPGTNIGHYKTQADHLAAELTPADTVLVGVTWNDMITPDPPLNEGSRQPPPDMRVVEGMLVSAGADAESAAARVRFYKMTGIIVPPFQNLKSFLDGLSQNSALAGLIYPHAKAVYYRLRRTNPVLDLVERGVPQGNFLYLDAMRRRIEARGARMVVALLAERQFFEDEAYRVYSVGGRDYPTQDYLNYLAEPWCLAYGITCINVFPLLREHQGEALVFRLDGHFNPTGTALLGPWLADRLYPE